MKFSLAVLGVCATQICLGSRYVLPNVLPNILKLEEDEETLSCLRHENLDLVAPPNPNHVLRKLAVRYEQDTSSDVYIVATGITVNSLTADMELTRKGETSFSFSITGDADYEKYQGVAKADLRIEGLDFTTEATTVEWLASMVADRDRLRAAQDVEMYFTLSGVASAVRNETSQDWDVQLMETAAEPFQFIVSDQWLLQKVLTKYGGVDKMLIDVIWPLVKQAVPKMLALLLQHMPPESLEFKTSAKVSGTSKKEALELDMNVTSNFDLSPGDAVMELFANYNLTDEFDLQIQEHEEMMLTSEYRRLQRDALLKTLHLYGINAGPGLLRDLARGGARSLVAFLQLLLPEHHSGHCIIEGLKVSTGVDIDWSDADVGTVRLIIGTADGTQEILRVPPDLRKLVCSRSMVRPDTGQLSKMTIENLRLLNGTLTLDTCKLSDIIFDTGNVSLAPDEDNFFVINGEFHDLFLSVPEGLRPPMNARCEEGAMSVNPDGVLSFVACRNGLRLDLQTAGDALGETQELQKPQDHEPDRLPARFSRHKRIWERPNMMDMVPFLHSSLGVVVTVSDDRLKFEARGGAHAKVDMRTILKAYAVEIGGEDEGFVYFTGSFKRFVTNGEADFSPDVTAILTCGFLRLIKPVANEASRLSTARLNMLPKSGQLQLDVRKYSFAPDIVTNEKGDTCLVLYSSGYVARKNWRWTDVQENLCGSSELVEGLRTAIQLQLDRWKGSSGGVSSERLLQEGDGSAQESPTRYRPNEQEALLQEKQVPAKEGFAEHHPQHDASLLQGDEAVSQDRKMCKAREDLDSKHYPPEAYWGTAVRMSIPGIPSIGDLHLVVGSVQLLKVSMNVTIGRKDDDTFNFILDGYSGPHAEIRAWVEDLDFKLPNSPATASFGKGFAKVENFFGSMVGKSDYGRLDQGVLVIKYAMSGDFKVNDDGTKWEVVRDTARQQLDIQFGAGGVVQGKINDAIRGANGVDQLFFDLVWPLLQKVIPQKLGEAFKAVPASEGMITHILHIDGSCPLPSGDGKRCPSQQFNVDIRDSIVIEGSLAPIIGRLRQNELRQNGQDWNFTKFVFDNLISAYNQSHVVLGSASGQLWSHIELDRTKHLYSMTRLSAHLPVPALNGLAGPNSVLPRLIPATGEVQAGGFVNFERGLLHIPGADVYHLRLPLQLPNGSDEIAMDGYLTRLSIEKLRRHRHCRSNASFGETSVGTAADGTAADGQVQEMPSLDIWSKSSAFSIWAPRFQVRATHDEGLDANFSRRGELHVNSKKEFVLDLLRKSTEFLNMPLNFRTGIETDADGQVPLEFRRRPAREPAKLRLEEAITTATIRVDLDAKINQADAIAEVPELLKSNVTLTIDGQLLLDNSFWRGLLDAMDQDFGYVHLSVYGTYRNRKVLARIGCGALDIFDASKTPYEELVESLELPRYFKSKPKLDHDIKLHEGARCFPIRDEHALCVQDDQGGQQLHRALRLQRGRFNSLQDAKAMSQHYGGQNALGTDATWFRELHPYDPTTFYPGARPGDDVESPLSAWKRLTRGLE